MKIVIVKKAGKIVKPRYCPVLLDGVDATKK
jgi:hypothetical protein